MNGTSLQGKRVVLLEKQDICRYCKFCHAPARHDGTPGDKITAATPDPGVCKRYPPVVHANGMSPMGHVQKPDGSEGPPIYAFQLNAAHPLVSLENRCGEFRPRLEKAH